MSDRRPGDDVRDSDTPRPREDDLGRLADDLSTTLRDLREELGRDPPRGPLGLPRPPTPRELLRFTDEYTIPTAIAVLETNIRLLEALRGAIRLARAGDEASKRGRDVRARTEELGRGSLDRLDDVLADLQGALEGRPENPKARSLLDDARALRHEIDDRLGETDGRHTDGTRRRAGGGRDVADTRPNVTDGPDETGVTIDVDSELDSIREEVNGDDDGDGDGDDT